MAKSNDSKDDYYKELLAKTIHAHTQEFGEEPTTLMINMGDEFCKGVLCHSSVVKSKAPYLYDLVQKSKRRGTLGMILGSRISKSR